MCEKSRLEFGCICMDNGETVKKGRAEREKKRRRGKKEKEMGDE